MADATADLKQLAIDLQAMETMVSANDAAIQAEIAEIRAGVASMNRDVIGTSCDHISFVSTASAQSAASVSAEANAMVAGLP